MQDAFKTVCERVAQSSYATGALHLSGKEDEMHNKINMEVEAPITDTVKHL